MSCILFLSKICIILLIGRLPSLKKVNLFWTILTTVLSIPQVDYPSSSIVISWSKKSLKTCFAVTGDMWLNRLADGAAIGHPDNSMSLRAVGWLGILMPTKPVPAVSSTGIN